MADVSDNEELIATRKLHGLDDDLFRENIEIGEYVRNKDGYIDKVKKIIEPNKDEYFEETYYICDIVMASSYKSDIVKHSKILSEVVKVGDYVNGKLIHKIDKGSNYCYLYYGNCKTFVDYQIKTILTKEIYRANCYKVGGE